MDVTVQFVVYVVVANILERCSTCGTLEAFHMQVLVLDAHKHTNNQTFTVSTNVLSRG